MTKKDSIYNALKKSILNGEYSAGDLLLSESDICKRYNVSREPTRRALKQLKEKGYLRSQQGKGYFINPREFYLNTTIAAISVEEKKVTTTTVLNFELGQTTTPLFFEKQLYQYDRIIETADNVIYEEGLIPFDLFPKFSIEHCQKSILAFFEVTMAQQLTHDRKILESVLIASDHPINRYLAEPITHAIQTTHHLYSNETLIQISHQIKKDSTITLISFN